MFKINMKNEVYDKLFFIMENIDNINKGKELGAWLTGEWLDKELYINDIIIPKQEVSSAEVDISPESMIELVKEVGQEKANKIVAHWHIHPFGKGETNWSSIDEEKIKEYMDPVKNRDVFVFLLSSEDRIFARVETNSKMKLGKEEFNIRNTFDKLNISKEIEIDKMKIIQEIKEKVNIKEYKKFESDYTLNTVNYQWENEHIGIEMKKNCIKLFLSPDANMHFMYYRENLGILPEREDVKDGKYRYIFNNLNEKEINELEEHLVEFEYEMYNVLSGEFVSNY